jgi:predicted metalloprotease with PDZ domain
MRVIAALLALMCAGFVVPAAAQPARVDYTLRPEMSAGAMQAMAVELSFTGDADGETNLALPSSWGGEEELWRVVADLSVAGATMVDGEGPGQRVLRHAPNARVMVRYRIVQDFAGPPMAAGRNPYRPVIRPGYFHLIGHTALILPDLADASPVRVRTRSLPRGWTYASDTQHGGLRLGNLGASVFVGGDFRVLNAPNGHARVAIRGEWSFSDRDFARQAGEIIGAQRDFWGDGRRPYLVTVMQLSSTDPGRRSVGGTGLTDAFAFFATANGDAAVITRTLAHEGNHTWIPEEIGGFPNDEMAERGGYWLSEGFTEFFTGRLLVRQGVWEPAEFAADLNAMLELYSGTDESTAPNARIIAGFWTDRAMRDLPYRRGRLLASVWDAQLRARGLSLDHVLRMMRARARAGDTRIATELFSAAMAEIGIDVSAELATYVEQGAWVRLPADAFGACGSVVTEEVPRFHRGFDIDATNANNLIIAGVDPRHNAYAAGLRDGMQILRRDAGEIGNANVELVYVVRDGDTERTIRYLPRGEGAYTRQRLVLAEPLDGERLTQCRAVLAGE